MNTRLTKIILSTITAITIVACGGSGVGVGVAGIGGSGFIASGSISGFGSVFVNGVEYEVNDSTTYDIDGVLQGEESDLAIGMIVQVSGTIDEGGTTGTATNISFDDELQGPISAVDIIGNDGVKLSFRILNVTVIVDSSSTTFDIDDHLPTDTIFDFDTIAQNNDIALNNNIEVSGFFNEADELIATRVELKDIIFNTESSTVELKGIVTNYIDDSNFKVNGFNVDASDLNVKREPESLIIMDTLSVEVEGTLDVTSTSIIAHKVETEDNSIEDTDEFELEGIITNYMNDGDFKINGINVNASGSDVKREPTLLILENDLRVEVEGYINDGTLFAEEIELESDNIKIHAKVTSVNSSEGTFEVTPNPITGQTIVVTVTTSTQLENDVTESELPFTLDDLIAHTDFVEIHGLDDGKGGITAVEVDVKEESDVILQGLATAAEFTSSNSGRITILGVTFNFDNLTDFEDESDTNLDDSKINTLINDINDTSTAPQLIKIEDKIATDEVNPAGTADEIDIE